jgi:hypothetical protein
MLFPLLFFLFIRGVQGVLQNVVQQHSRRGQANPVPQHVVAVALADEGLLDGLRVLLRGGSNLGLLRLLDFDDWLGDFRLAHNRQADPE